MPVPDGKPYALNSVDIIIKDAEGKVVKKYQSKYCKDAAATKKAFESGDYRGQRKLVPGDQAAEMGIKVSDVIEAPDGTKSNPLTKAEAKELQVEAQNGDWNRLDWNAYDQREIAKQLGKKAGYAAIQGAAIGIGINVAQKIWDKEEIDGEEVLKSAVEGGADFGVKAAVAGALQVSVEKGIVTTLPKTTPFGDLAFLAVENAKVAAKVVSGEYTVSEGLDKMEQTTVASVAGLATMAEGAAIGSSIGALLGPAGMAIGGFVCGSIGYMAGSKVGETVVKGIQNIRRKAVEKTCEIVGTIGSGIKNTIGSFISLFSF